MTALAIDLGGTKLSFAVFTQQGKMLYKHIIALEKRTGRQVAELIAGEAQKIVNDHNIDFIGIAVPGIYHNKTGKVWAPNISGWDDYPLMQQMRESVNIPVTIDSDRACYILGESWKGNAQGSTDAIYLAVGTGIGAGVLAGGKIVRGGHDIAGAIGWMALQQPFEEKYISCGCFEYHGSGEGIVKVASEVLHQHTEYKGALSQKAVLTAHDVFEAFGNNDDVAKEIFSICIRFWGMAVANLVSLFDPEKIILGGGVFGPAVQFIPAIKEEAAKWAQPISMKMVCIQPSALGADAGLYGAGLLAFQNNNLQKHV